MCDRHLHAQVPISTNPALPLPGESGLLLDSVQIRITIDPLPRNVQRAREVRHLRLPPVLLMAGMGQHAACQGSCMGKRPLDGLLILLSSS